MFHVILIVVLLMFVGSCTAWASGPVVFFKGTDGGCFFHSAGTAEWQAVPGNRLVCGPQIGLKTEAQSWGTIVYSFGTLTIRPSSEILFQANGLVLTRGSYRAFIQANPKGFQFRTPQAMVGIRGTVFSANADGGISVQSGSVEVTPNQGAPVQVSAGYSYVPTEPACILNVPPEGGEGPLSETMQSLEKALQAEHDHQYRVAAEAYLRILRDPLLPKSDEYRRHLAESALKNLALSGVGSKDSLTQLAAVVLRQDVEAWHGVMETFLRQGLSEPIRSLLNLSSTLRPGQKPDFRDTVTKGLLAELEKDLQALKSAGNSLQNASGSASGGADAFWKDSQTYIQVLASGRPVDPSRITQMISPSGLNGMAAELARRRVAAGTSLPFGVLEAQGLYYLVRAHLAAGNTANAERIMSYFRKNFPDSGWLARSESLLARQPKTVSEGASKTQSVRVRKSKPSSSVRGDSEKPTVAHRDGKTNQQGVGAAIGNVASPAVNLTPQSGAEAADGIRKAY